MTIYITTENNFLYNGIQHMLAGVTEHICVHIKSMEEFSSTIKHLESPDDIYIIATAFSNIDFFLLMALHNAEAPVIMVNVDMIWNINSIFKFPILINKFHSSDLLQAINSVKIKRSDIIILPSITPSEKKVLQLTLSGVNIRHIGLQLNIQTKSTYSHIYNAYRKIGIKKTHDIFKLPRNYINYLLHSL